MSPKRDGYLDALAWMDVYIARDHDGKMAIARNTDPVMLVEALTIMFLSLIRVSTLGQESAYIQALRDNVDNVLGDIE